MSKIRETIESALKKRLPEDDQDCGPDVFDPWHDVIQGIHGCYSSESDELMIEVLEAVRDRTTFDLMRNKGFVIEFMLYVLSGHGLTDYGTSPRGGWPDYEIEDLWQPLIDKWKAYYVISWGEPTANTDPKESE